LTISSITCNARQGRFCCHQGFKKVSSCLSRFTPKKTSLRIGSMELKETELHRINFKDDRFRISYFVELDKLKRSIAECGLLSPLLTTPRDGDLVIAAGWRRALACRDLSFSPVPCFILEEPEDGKVFLLAVLENLAAKDFNVLEKAVVLKKLKAFGMEEALILETYLPLFGIPQNLSYLDDYLAISEFDAETKAFIHTRNVSYPVIRFLLELTREERAMLIPHLRYLGQNKQREFLEFLLETSQREDLSVREILASDAIADVIQSEALPSAQKADSIRLLLRKRRYPSYSAREEAFALALKNMEWPEDIVLHHSPFFEGEEFSVRFAFKKDAEFKDKVQQLHTIAATNRITELLKTISHD